jgi:hypothetical protein
MEELTAVIPDAAKRRSGIHIPGAGDNRQTGVMDSGYAGFARAPE